MNEITVEQKMHLIFELINYLKKYGLWHEGNVAIYCDGIIYDGYSGQDDEYEKSSYDNMVFLGKYKVEQKEEHILRIIMDGNVQDFFCMDNYYLHDIDMVSQEIKNKIFEYEYGEDMHNDNQHYKEYRDEYLVNLLDVDDYEERLMIKYTEELEFYEELWAEIQKKYSCRCLPIEFVEEMKKEFKLIFKTYELKYSWVSDYELGINYI